MTAAKEKGSRRENETAAAGNKKGTSEQSAATDAKHAQDEVFDSSKYNAMNDMAKGAQKSEISADMAYAQKVSTQEQVPEGTDPDIPKVNPMMVEERARTIRAANEDMPRQQSSYSSKENFVLYLNIMLSIENAAIERLHARIQQCPLPQVRAQLVHHLEETRQQKDRLISLVQMLGGQPTQERAQLARYSPPPSLADALQAATATEEKELITLGIDALIEQQEALGYNALIQIATKMNIGEALAPMRQSLQEEEGMVVWARANFPASFAQLWSAMEQKSR